VLVIGAIWIAYHLRGKVEEKPFLKADEREVERTEKGEMDQRLSRGQSRSSTSGTVEPKASGMVEMKGEISEKKSETSGIPQMKSETDEGIGKAGERADKGAEELSPELQRKVETYAELAKLLPIAKREFEVMVTFPAGDANRTPEQLAFIREAAERDTLGRILALVEPVMGPIGPPAIHRDERGVVQQVNMGPLFTQIAAYMGKELPFDGNSDYFSTKDYQGGTGGW